MATSYLNQANRPRGLRNNNPGNIRKSSINWQGKITPGADSAFEQFVSMEYGFRALMVLLTTYFEKHNLRTVQAIINRWAPPSENQTNKYIDFVARHLKVSATAELVPDKATLTKLAHAIAYMENGKWLPISIIEEAHGLLKKNIYIETSQSSIDKPIGRGHWLGTVFGNKKS